MDAEAEDEGGESSQLSPPPIPRRRKSGGGVGGNASGDEDVEMMEDHQGSPSSLRGTAAAGGGGGRPGAANPDGDDAEEDEDDGPGLYRRLSVFGEHKRAVSSVKFAPSRYTKPGGAMVATASASAFIKLWDLNEGTLDEASRVRRKTVKAGGGATKTYRKPDAAIDYATLCLGHSRGVNDLCWNPVSPLLASGSDDKTVRLWDCTSGEALVEFRGHDNFVFCVSMHHSLLASGSFDETVKLFDIRSGECVSTLPAHSDPVTAVAFNRDGTCVASASHDGLIRIWDVGTSECLKTIFASGNPPVASVAYSPNGKYLLASTLDSCIRLWPVNKTGNARCAKTYRNEKWHVNTKYSVVSDFTHDGNVLTGSEAGRPVLYDLQSRQVLQTLRGHTDVVLAVSAHDKLPLLCTGGMTSDRKVYFWMRRDGVDEVEEEEGEEEKERRDGIPGENVESRGAVEEEAAPEAVMAINSSDDEATDSPNAKKLKS